MRARRLGSTDVTVSELGFGAAPIGNLYRAIDDDAAQETIDAAWRGGIRYFDTAPHYGLGLSERRLGAALAGYPRSDVHHLDEGRSAAGGQPIAHRLGSRSGRVRRPGRTDRDA